MFEKLSFRTKLFIYYSVLICAVTLVFSVISYIYISRQLEGRELEEMEGTTSRIVSSLDLMVDQMDIVSLLVCFNRNVQYQFLDALNFTENTNYFAKYTPAKNEVIDAVSPIKAARNSVYRITLFNAKGDFVTISTLGHDDLSCKFPNLKLNQLDLLDKEKIYTIVHPTSKDIWDNTLQPEKVVSISRKLFYTYGNKIHLGYAEVQQSYTILSSICQPSNPTSKILIVANDGNVVYPDNTGKDVAAYYMLKASDNSDKKFFTLKNPQNESEEFVYRTTSSVSNWNVFYIKSKKEAMSSVFGVQMAFLAAGAFSLFLMLALVYLITRRATLPLLKIVGSLKNVSLDKPSLKLDLPEYGNEISLLDSAFNNMMERLSTNVSQVIKSKTSEIEAHFLALQAQMNPHFLNNSLMIISLMSQECGSSNIPSFCSSLSRMLRYTASYKNSDVTLKQELEHVEDYLELMKYQYLDRFNYSIDIPQDMNMLLVPKLIVQPLLENCFEHGFSKSRPPWRVGITGSRLNEKWHISITDNGSGFSQESIELIKSTIGKWNDLINSGTIPNRLEIGGMAIINIYIRLRLFYGPSAHMEITNSAEGTTVRIEGVWRVMEVKHDTNTGS